MNGYSILPGKGGSAAVVQMLLDHDLVFQHIGYYKNALEESIRAGHVGVTKIMRKMKINPDATGIVCVFLMFNYYNNSIRHN